MPQTGRKLKRDQHGAFGTEIRKLCTSTIAADRELAGVLDSELALLAVLKAEGRRHSKEDSLSGPELREIHYLRLYRMGHSVRVYFTVISGVIWMLLLNVSKRETKLSAGDEESLRSRLREVKERAMTQERPA